MVEKTDSAQGYVEVVALILIENEQALVAQRPQGDALAGKWEFPGGKVELGESPEEALIREIYEEIGISIVVDRHIMTTVYSGTPLSVKIHAYTGRRLEGEIRALAHTELRWVKRTELESLNWAPADIAIARAVQRLMV